MKYFKLSFWAVIICSILSLVLQVKKYNNERKALIEAEELATYGGKKPTKLKPDEWKIQISGSLPQGVRYTASVRYSANIDSKQCKSWSLFGGLSAKLKNFKYSPEIKNTLHALTIPLGELNPDDGCQYEADNVQICLTRGKEKPFNCSYLFTKEHPDTFSRPYRQVSNNILNIECFTLDNDEYISPHLTCHQSPAYENIKVTQSLSLPRYSGEYEINIKLLPRDKYLNGLFLHSSYYKRKVNFLKKSYKESKITPVSPENTEILIANFNQHHDSIYEQINDLVKTNEKIKADMMSCDICNPRIIKILESTSEWLSQSIETENNHRVLAHQLLYSGDVDVNIPLLSAHDLDAVFLYSDYYRREIKFLMKKFRTAYSTSTDTPETTERELARDYPELYPVLRRTISAYANIKNRLCSSCSPEAIKLLDSNIHNLKQTIQGDVMKNIRHTEALLLLNNS